RLAFGLITHALPPEMAQVSRSINYSSGTSSCSQVSFPQGAADGGARTRTPDGPDPAARPPRRLAGPASGAAGTRSAPYAAPRSPGPAARSTPAPLPPLPLPAAARSRSPIGASEDLLSGPNHRQAPFRSQHSVTRRLRAAGTGAGGNRSSAHSFPRSGRVFSSILD